MHRITQVAVRAGYQLDLAFADGTRGTADVSDLVGKGIFSPWSDYAEFQKVRIGDTGELIWSTQVDLCPDALYLRVTGKKAEEVFPDLQRARVHA